MYGSFSDNLILSIYTLWETKEFAKGNHQLNRSVLPLTLPLALPGLWMSWSKWKMESQKWMMMMMMMMMMILMGQISRPTRTHRKVGHLFSWDDFLMSRTMKTWYSKLDNIRGQCRRHAAASCQICQMQTRWTPQLLNQPASAKQQQKWWIGYIMCTLNSWIPSRPVAQSIVENCVALKNPFAKVKNPWSRQRDLQIHRRSSEWKPTFRGECWPRMDTVFHQEGTPSYNQHRYHWRVYS